MILFLDFSFILFAFSVDGKVRFTLFRETGFYWTHDNKTLWIFRGALFLRIWLQWHKKRISLCSLIDWFQTWTRLCRWLCPELMRTMRTGHSGCRGQDTEDRTLRTLKTGHWGCWGQDIENAEDAKDRTPRTRTEDGTVRMLKTGHSGCRGQDSEDAEDRTLG